MTPGTCRAILTTAWALACQGHWDGPSLALLKRLYLRIHLSLTPMDVMRVAALNLAVRTVSPVPNLCVGERLHLLESALRRREAAVEAAAAGRGGRGAGEEDGGPGAGMADAPRGGTVEVIDPAGRVLDCQVLPKSQAASRLAPALDRALADALCDLDPAATEGPARGLLASAHDFVTHELLLFDWALPAARVALRVMTPQ